MCVNLLIIWECLPVKVGFLFLTFQKKFFYRRHLPMRAYIYGLRNPSRFVFKKKFRNEIQMLHVHIWNRKSFLFEIWILFSVFLLVHTPTCFSFLYLSDYKITAYC